MIEPQTRDSIVYSELKEDNQFKVKLSPKAFHILSAQLYKYKIRAIIRELSCNAVDAQKEAGVTRPFQVNLPNAFLPVFSIRDFGTGIKEEDMYNIFTVLFESTKTNSNDFTGMLGLGSKTPFAYVETFTVTSFQEGIKKTYIALMGGNKVPSLNLVSTDPTDEPEGLQIQFAVEPKDFQEFYNEAKHVYKVFFDIKPEIRGHDLKLDEIQSKFVFYNNRSIFIEERRYSSDLYVVQGNIAYPVDKHKIKSRFITDFVFLGDLYVQVPIGTVTFLPNREEIEDKPENYQAIEKYLDGSDLYDEFLSKVDQILSGVDSQYKACEVYNMYDKGELSCGFKTDLIAEKIREKGFIPATSLSFSWCSDLRKLLDVLDYSQEGHYGNQLYTGGEPYVLYIREDFRGSLKYINFDIKKNNTRCFVLNKPFDTIEKRLDKETGLEEEIEVKREWALAEILEKYGEFFKVVKSSELKDYYKEDFKVKRDKLNIFKTNPRDWDYKHHDLTSESKFFYLYYKNDSTLLKDVFFAYKDVLEILSNEFFGKPSELNSLVIVRKTDKPCLKNFPHALDIEECLPKYLFKRYGAKKVISDLRDLSIKPENFDLELKNFKKIKKLTFPGEKYPFEIHVNSIFDKSRVDKDLKFIYTSFSSRNTSKYFRDNLADKLKVDRNFLKHPRKEERLDYIYSWFKEKIPLIFEMDTRSLDDVKYRENFNILFNYYFNKEKEVN